MMTSMRQSESITKLAPALVRAQAEVENALKNATNPHFKSKYADLEEVIRTVKPVFTAHGIAILQLPGFDEGHATVETMLVHESGEWIAGVSGAPLQKEDPQGVGSAITYLRRYSLAAVAAIAQEDDDGQGLRRNGKDAGEKITEQQLADLSALADEVGASKPKFLRFMKVQRWEDIPASRYADAVKALEGKRTLDKEMKATKEKFAGAAR